MVGGLLHLLLLVYGSQLQAYALTLPMYRMKAMVNERSELLLIIKVQRDHQCCVNNNKLCAIFVLPILVKCISWFQIKSWEDQ